MAPRLLLTIVFAVSGLTLFRSLTEMPILTISVAEVRAAPRSDAPIVARFPLGTETTSYGYRLTPDAWYRVKLAGRGDGWIRADVTVDIPPVLRDLTIEDVIKARLDQPETSFEGRRDLLDLIERQSDRLSTDEVRGRFGVYWLRALASAAQAVSCRQTPMPEPYGSWMSRFRDYLSWEASGAFWKLKPETIRQLERRYRSTPAAADIAALAAHQF